MAAKDRDTVAKKELTCLLERVSYCTELGRGIAVTCPAASTGNASIPVRRESITLVQYV